MTLVYSLRVLSPEGFEIESRGATIPEAFARMLSAEPFRDPACDEDGQEYPGQLSSDQIDENRASLLAFFGSLMSEDRDLSGPPGKIVASFSSIPELAFNLRNAIEKS